MTDETGILDYLERGGKLSSPDNAPARYRAELLRQMASFVDSEIAGAAGFAECINLGPRIVARIAASRIVLEKFDHAERVLKIMGEFGADTTRYETLHPWTARIERDRDLGAKRLPGDMRLNVFHYPIAGWTDALTMNVLMGVATVIQLEELADGSYQPLAEIFREILPRETRHAELGEEGLRQLAAEGKQQRDEIAASVAYWRGRVAASFGAIESPRFDLLRRFGLRHRPNEELLAAWNQKLDALLPDILG